MRKKLVKSTILATVLVSALLTGCGSSGSATSAASTSTATTEQAGTENTEGQTADAGYKMTFILKSLGSNYWVQLKAGAVDKAEELGIDLECLAPSSDNATEDQIRMLEDQTVSDVDLVLVAPSNSGAETATFDKVVDAGIPLIFVDTNAKDYTKKTAFIGSSNSDVGKAAGEYITSNVSDKNGAVIVLRGQLGDETADTRCSGFKEELESNGFTNIIEQPASNDRSTAMGVMENMLQSEDNITAVYGTNDEMALGAAKALQDANNDSIIVVGTNADVDALNSIINGTGVTASVRQDPYNMGQKAIETAFNVVSQKDYDEETIIPVRVIDKDNAQETLDEVNKVLSDNK